MDSGIINHWVSENFEKCMNNVAVMKYALGINIANGDIKRGAKRGHLRLKAQNIIDGIAITINIPTIIVP